MLLSLPAPDCKPFFFSFFKNMSFPSKNSNWMLLKQDNQICSLVLKKKTKTNNYNSSLLTHFSNHVTVNATNVSHLRTELLGARVG